MVNYKYTEKYTNRTINIFSYIVILNGINIEKTPLRKVMKRILFIVYFLILVAKDISCDMKTYFFLYFGKFSCSFASLDQLLIFYPFHFLYCELSLSLV